VSRETQAVTTTHTSSSTHTLFFRLVPGDTLPGSLAERLKADGVATGLLRGHGILEHVEVRTFSPQTRTLGPGRLLGGAVHALVLEGVVGLESGMPAVSLRAVLSRETDVGTETLSGVVTSARVVALELVVISAQDLALPLAHDARSGLSMLAATGADATPNAPAAEPRRPEPSPAPAPAAWGEAVAATHAQAPPRPLASQAGPALPTRPPARPVVEQDEVVFPEAGDQVEHFAFGKCDVLRSDGDRLHLRVHKDGRIREIALEMLKVTPQDDGTTRPRHFRLERRL
jgi:predicted DNA-binding protein with PD1-like motif